MKPIRVTIFFSGNFPNGGATATRIKGYLNYLPKDIQPTIRLIWPEQDRKYSEQTASSVSGQWQGIPYKFLNEKPYRPDSFTGKLQDTLISWKNMVSDIIKRRKEIDLIYIYNPEIHYVFPILITARFLGIPVIGEQTELQSEVFNQAGMRNKIFKPLKSRSEQKLHKWFKHLIVISSKLEKFYKPKFGNEITRITAFADANRFNITASFPEVFTIGYIGSFGLKDGIPAMLSAIAAFRANNPLIRIVLIGNHYAYPSLKRQLQHFQLEDITQLTGPVEESEVPELLGKCSVLICNRNNSNYAACGFPSKVVEYAAAGVPVIASDTGDARSIFGETMYWITPENQEQLTLALEHINKNPGYYGDLALKSCNIFKEQLTAEKAALQLAVLFRKFALD